MFVLYSILCFSYLFLYLRSSVHFHSIAIIAFHLICILSSTSSLPLHVISVFLLCPALLISLLYLSVFPSSFSLSPFSLLYFPPFLSLFIDRYCPSPSPFRSLVSLISLFPLPLTFSLILYISPNLPPFHSPFFLSSYSIPYLPLSKFPLLSFLSQYYSFSPTHIFVVVSNSLIF